MKPRVFISSTYYDLKYVRENLELFINQYGFEPVLFESGKVTFEHGKPLDSSCYQEVDLCQLMVLIIGGRYGSQISSENSEKDIEEYNKEYVSITRRELETAQKKNIPVFIFIDKNVYAEYQTYKENEQYFDQETSKTFRFAHVDSINVFKFIDSVLKTAIKTFDKVEEIIEYLRTQFAGMFFLYLDRLRQEKKEQEILDSVNQLNSIAIKIDNMVHAVGKKVIDEEQFKEIQNNQFKASVDFFIDHFENFLTDISFDCSSEKDAHDATLIFQNDILEQHLDFRPFELEGKVNEINNKVLKKLAVHYSSFNPINPYKTFKVINNYQKRIRPFMNTEENKAYFFDKLQYSLTNYDLPF